MEYHIFLPFKTIYFGFFLLLLTETRIELSTLGLKGYCSTTVLPQLALDIKDLIEGAVEK